MLLLRCVLVLALVHYSVGVAKCPHSDTQCDGCQCCPDGCLCPDATCTPNPCSKPEAECKPTPKPTTKRPTTLSPTTVTQKHTTKGPTGTPGTTKKTTRGPTKGTTVTTTVSPGQLLFSDSFDTLDFKKWKHELTMGGGGNWEFELYQNNRTTSYVKNGVLHIRPGMTADLFGINGEALVRTGREINMWGASPAEMCTGNAFYGCDRTSGAGGNYINPITSARLRTAEHFSFKYGKVEVRAKLPKGDWLWPAIWLLPVDNEYGNWPASGEIDMVESRGNLNYPASAGGGPESFGSTLHYGPAYDMDIWQKTHKVYSLPSGTFNDDFHTFGLVWGPDRIYTYVDEETNIVLDQKITQDFWTFGGFPSSYENPWNSSVNVNAPFDKEYYLILNLAVGGTGGYFPDGVGGKPWTNADQHSVNAFYNAKAQWYSTWDAKGDGSSLLVDSVNVWAL